jgi:hypothetical protein
MAIQTPDKESGIICELDAHVKGDTGEYCGGWASALKIGDATVTAHLDSKVKGVDSSTSCSAFLTLVRPVNETVLQLGLALDTENINNIKAAGLLSSLINAPSKTVEVQATIEAWNTTPSEAVLTSVSVNGYIKTEQGRFVIDRDGYWENGTHKFERFIVAIVPKSKTVLSVNFGGTLNKTWPISPATK